MVFLTATFAFGQGQDHSPDLFNYGMLMHLAISDRIVQKIEAAGQPSKAARDHAKQETGLTDAQQAILVRYANQFYAANMAMFSARDAALQANDAKGAQQAEQAFHTSAVSLIQALKDELGPGAWGTLQSNAHKNFSPVIKDITHSKKGGN
jgi:hypothetical protein